MDAWLQSARRKLLAKLLYHVLLAFSISSENFSEKGEEKKMGKVAHFDQVVGPDQAQVWLTDHRYIHQRPLSERHVTILTKAMELDQFTSVEPISFSAINGKTHLINGQHRLSAVVRSKKPQHFVIIHHEVDTPEEEADLYFKFDRQRKRTFADGMRAIGMVDELRLTETQIKVAASALRFAKCNFGADRDALSLVSIEDLLEWVGFWTWEINALYNAITPCTTKDRNLIIRQAVFSVALITMRYQPAKAREFWRQVAQDDGMGQYDPRKTLRNWLKEKATRSTYTEAVKASQVARGVALAWNAYFEDRTLRFILIRDATKPISLCGTAYKGNQDPDWLPLYPSPHIEAERAG